MPCTLTGSFEGDRALVSETNVTYLTQLLCGACTLLEANNIDMGGVVVEGLGNDDLVQGAPSLDKWWKDHKKMDRRRKRDDRKRRKDQK